jgi:Family of unknown function (DUF5670)
VLFLAGNPGTTIELAGRQDQALGSTEQEDFMLWTILVILLVLWLLGMVTSYTMGGLIHILLVVAVVVLVIRLVSGRRVV